MSTTFAGSRLRSLWPTVAIALGWLDAGCTCGGDRLARDAGTDAQAATDSGAAADADAIGPNLKLSRGGRFNGEPTIAVNPLEPNNLIAAWMHSAEQEQIEIVVVSSEDAGATWADPRSLGHVDPAYTVSADVSVAFDSAGTAHLTYIEIEPDPDVGASCEFHIGSAEVVHRRSDDGGRNWSAPVRVRHSTDTPDFAIDRPWVAVDRSGGPFDGRVYVVSISFYCNNPPPQHVHLRSSMDQGATWSDDLHVDDAEYGTGPYPDLPFPAVIGVGGDGAVWVVYPSVGGQACGGGLSICLLAAVSQDGGQTFSRSRVADVTPAGSRGFPAFQTLAAHQALGGQCSVFWPDGRLDPAGSDLLFVRSEDSGETWSEPVRINDNPPGLGVGVDQPWAAAADEGSMAVLWRDRRSAGAGPDVAFEAYVAVSADGADLMPNVRLSDQPSPYSAVPCCNSFLGLALGGGWLHADWADFREGRWEVFYGRMPLDQ